MTDLIQAFDKLSGLAALLYSEDAETRTYANDDLNGVSEILRGIAGELLQIDNDHTKELELKSGRERRLEQFMDDMATRMDQEPEDWNFPAAADNIRAVLSR